MDKKIPDLYHPAKPCGDLDDLLVPADVEVGPVMKACPAHGHYAVRYWGATFSQSRSTGQVTEVQRYPMLAVLNVN